MFDVFSPALLFALITLSILLALPALRLRRSSRLSVPTLAGAIFIGLSWLIAMVAIVYKVR